MGCLCCLLKSSAKRKNKTKSKITPQALAPRPVQQVQPGTYSYKPTSQQPQAQQYQQSQPYQAYQPQSQYPPQGMNGGAPFDPRKAAANAAMAQQAGACKSPSPKFHLPSTAPAGPCVAV
jgi:hypothetical protein